MSAAPVHPPRARPPFRLLAITPPTGPVPADMLARWLAAGAASVGLAVLLREPGRSAHELLADDARLTPLRRRCHQHGVPVLLSIAPTELLASPGPADLLRTLDRTALAELSGLHLRGDPDLPQLTRLRAALPARPDPSTIPAPTASAPDSTPRPAPPPVPSAIPPPTRPLPASAPGPTPRPDAPPVPSDIPPAPAASPVLSDIPRPLWLGRSCHGAPAPGHDRVDYTLFAPVFAPTTAQPGRPLGSKLPAGLAALRAWTREPGAVIFALGGVTPATAPACLAAGAFGLAGIGVFFGEPSRVEQDVAALREIVAARDRHVEPVSP